QQVRLDREEREQVRHACERRAGARIAGDDDRFDHESGEHRQCGNGVPGAPDRAERSLRHITASRPCAARTGELLRQAVWYAARMAWTGLTDDEAARRLRDDGPNELASADRAGIFRMLLQVMREPML